MEIILFIFTNIMLGVGLAMDAFSVSIANGLSEHNMKLPRELLITGTFGFYQAAMPLIGWFFVHNLVSIFKVLDNFIPWIAFILLGYIGGKMIFDGIKDNGGGSEAGAGADVKRLTFGMLMVQGVATSIDALSVGFTIAEYNFLMALIAALIIAAVTFIICMAGIKIGKTVGNKISGKATIVGGIILVVIGLWILVKSII